MTQHTALDAAERASTPTVGQMLRDARVAHGLELRDLAALTKIQSALLAYLEEDRFDEFPAEVFARGFVKNYARELRLDEDLVLARYREQLGLRAETPVAVVVEEPSAEEERDERLLANAPVTSRALYAAGLALVVLGLAVSVLVFGRSDAGTTSANYQPTEIDTAWEPVPAGQDDWQTYREN